MTLQADLAKRLGDSTCLVARWREWHGPDISAIATPTTEAEVREIRDAPFIVRSGGHGATEALAKARNAIQIDMRKMNKVELSANGQSVTVGGGTNVKELVAGLASKGKRTVTEICELVGVSAVILGGGHGWLQVGTSSIRYCPSERSYEIFIFSSDKLERLYTLTNEMMKTQPPETPMARENARPLHEIEPIMVKAGMADTHELAEITFQGENSPGCAYGLTSIRYPVGLKSYNIAALSKVYDDIDETFKRVPELSGSFFLLERYSTQDVEAIDTESAAFPPREDKHLVTSYIQCQPDTAIGSAAQSSVFDLGTTCWREATTRRIFGHTSIMRMAQRVCQRFMVRMKRDWHVGRV
ncbi:FAD-binding domain-containing protein [Xylariaceae sp. FL1272]|nr:FAD-binding domain-containing protein [Xylariaceae sp. FL1272]